MKQPVIYVNGQELRDIQELTECILDDNGFEVNDPKPLFIETGLDKSETLEQRIKRIMEHSIARKAYLQGMETVEEANDFDILDEFEVENPITDYELHSMTEEFMASREEAVPTPSSKKGVASEPIPAAEVNSEPLGQE